MENKKFNEKDKINNFSGNYLNYYASRNKDDDARTSLLRNEWIHGKSCLDIGCNTGEFTLSIGRKFSPLHITGIDNDLNLINVAKSNLLKLKAAKNQKANLFIPRSIPMIKDDEKKLPFPNNITFVVDDILSCHLQKKYSVILCMSVVKWIHLNRGDEGLKLLFTNISHLLEENGIFILEYQPWKSYKNNRKTNQLINENFKKIAIKPDQFEDILINEYHFEKLAHLGPSLEEAREYHRPILVLKKTRNIIDTIGIHNSSNELKDINIIQQSQLIAVENTQIKTKKKRIKLSNKILESTAQHPKEDTILENHTSSDMMKEVKEVKECRHELSLPIVNTKSTLLSSSLNNDMLFHNQIIHKKKRKRKNKAQSIEEELDPSLSTSTGSTTIAFSETLRDGNKGQGKELSWSQEEMKKKNSHNVIPVAVLSGISVESEGIKKNKKMKKILVDGDSLVTIA